MYVWTKAYENYVESPCKMMPSYQNTGVQLILFFRSDILLQQISLN